MMQKVEGRETRTRRLCVPIVDVHFDVGSSFHLHSCTLILLVFLWMCVCLSKGNQNFILHMRKWGERIVSAHHRKSGDNADIHHTMYQMHF